MFSMIRAVRYLMNPRHHLAGTRFYKSNDMDFLKQEFKSSYHFVDLEQLGQAFDTDLENGLTEDQAGERLKSYGQNRLNKMKAINYWNMFRHNFFGSVQCAVWVLTLTCFITYDLHVTLLVEPENEYFYMAYILAVNVVGAGIFCMYQDIKASSNVSAFDDVVPSHSTVVRNGVKKVIPTAELVVGDIVEMAQGQLVPADIRITYCNKFRTDKVSLTGQSHPVSHIIECSDVNPLYSKNVVLLGCSVVEGIARGVVVNTGNMTEVGKILGLVTGEKKQASPIEKQISTFIKVVFALASGVGFIFFTIAMYLGSTWPLAIKYFLGIVLSNVPEGFLVSFSISFFLAMIRLKERKCFAKSYHVAGSLGSTSCICFGKTGTLSLTGMVVSHLYSNFEAIDKSDQSHAVEVTYAELCLCACLNLTAEFVDTNVDMAIEERKIKGNALETAILRFMEMYRSATKVQVKYPKEAEISFSIDNKYQVTIHRTPLENGYYLTMKGAPEVVLLFCTRILTKDGEQALNDNVIEELSTVFTNFSNAGETVIGYCRLNLPVDQYPLGYKFDTENIHFPLEGMTFIGAITIAEPPRPEVKKVIDLCRKAGIRVCMVSGDNPVRTLATSRHANLISENSAYKYSLANHIELSDVGDDNNFKAAVITGDALRTKTIVELKEAIRNYPELTFARVSPEQKMLIIQAFQELDYVVAFCGDGMNNAPALKKADIGVALGNGSLVSKQAADLIIVNNNLITLIKGIEEGRKIYDRVKLNVVYTLTSNAPETMAFVVHAFFGIPLPISLILTVVINLGVDLMPATSLYFEDSEQDVLRTWKRKSIFNRALIFMSYFQIGMIQFFAGITAYFLVFADEGFYPPSLLFISRRWVMLAESVLDSSGQEWLYGDRKKVERKAQTAYFVAICWTQISNLIICKTRRVSLLSKGMRNKVLNMSIPGTLISSYLLCNFPIFNEYLNTERLEWYFMCSAIPFMFLIILSDEIRRYIVRNKTGRISQWLKRETYY